MTLSIVLVFFYLFFIVFLYFFFVFCFYFFLSSSSRFLKKNGKKAQLFKNSFTDLREKGEENILAAATYYIFFSKVNKK